MSAPDVSPRDALAALLLERFGDWYGGDITDQEAVDGAHDDAEWLAVRGVRVESPRPAPVTRFEVIDHRYLGSGRVFVAWPATVELSYQDDGRTLKVFVTDPTTANVQLGASKGTT